MSNTDFNDLIRMKPKDWSEFSHTHTLECHSTASTFSQVQVPISVATLCTPISLNLLANVAWFHHKTATNNDDTQIKKTIIDFLVLCQIHSSCNTCDIDLSLNRQSAILNSLNRSLSVQSPLTLYHKLKECHRN